MIIMNILHKPDGFDANNSSYLRKIQRSLGKKGA